jgi:hypothetical protein
MRPATARHKGFEVTKITVFPARQTTGCHFSKGALWGVRAENT